MHYLSRHLERPTLFLISLIRFLCQLEIISAEHLLLVMLFKTLI